MKRTLNFEDKNKWYHLETLKKNSIIIIKQNIQNKRMQKESNLLLLFSSVYGKSMAI